MITSDRHIRQFLKQRSYNQFINNGTELIRAICPVSQDTGKTLSAMQNIHNKETKMETLQNQQRPTYSDGPQECNEMFASITGHKRLFQ